MPDIDPAFVPARLVLEDGSIFPGRAFGRTTPGSSSGEVVFNTAMCGYQEALTDPSYAGQILVMTAPMIGNYGVAPDDIESAHPHVAGFVVRELSRIHSNQRAARGLPEWLESSGVSAIEGVDTRALVRRLRTAGVMRGVVSVNEARTDAELIEQAKRIPSMSGQNLAATVSPASSGIWSGDLGEWGDAAFGERLPVTPARNATPAATQSATQPATGTEAAGEDAARAAMPAAVVTTRPWRVLAIDCGAKRNIYRHLTERGCEVEFAPHDLSAAAIRERKPDGLFISNGPGDPAAVEETVATLREVAGEIPTFGICLGHQLLALALGARTYKLKFGHRGANQPVRDLRSGRVEITSQNHGFCVDEASLREVGGEPTHVHLNDGTLAGFRHLSKPIFAVQYHPEASPGPHDSTYLFDEFVSMMQASTPR